MDITKEDPQLLQHLEGKLTYLGNPEVKFSGVIKKGLRLVFWGNSERRVTSCVFTEDLDMRVNREVVTEIIIFSGRSIDKVIETGESYPIGIPGSKMGDFEIFKIKGQWTGKLPQFD